MICKDNYAATVSQITPHGHLKWSNRAVMTITMRPAGVLTDSIVRHNKDYAHGALVTRFGVPAGRDRKRSKSDALAEDGALNPAPEKVRDLKFQEGGFFDPGDIVQVKYEMLRRASVEKASVTEVSEEYGVSRPTYYQAKADFDESGIAGTRTQEARSPRPTQDPGRSLGVPQGADFPWRTDTRARVGEVAPEGVRPRCPSKNDRTSGRCKKNSEMTGITASLTALAPATVVARYERLRSAMLGEALPPDARSGLVVFLHRGMWGWARALSVEPARLEPIPSRSSAPAQLIERRAIVCLLAGMVMAINDRRAL